MGLPDWVLPFKEPRTEIKRLNNRYYKYEVSYHYSPEQKRTIKKTGRLLGKITREDGFLPSEKNKLREEAESIPKVDIKTYGVYALFEKLLEDEIPLLISVFGKERAEQLLTFAMMRWAYQSPIKRAAYYQAHDFCSEKWSEKTALNDKKITELLKYTGENRQMVLEWLKRLFPYAGDGRGGFVMMDSTHIVSGSENLNVNMPGYNSSFDFGKQARLMYMFSSEIKRPVYYRLINGNITDITSMSLCVKETGIKNVVFIADKGFYSEANIKALEGENLKYLIPLRRNNPAVDYGPLEAGGFKRNLKHFTYQKRIIWYYKYSKDGRNYITFL